MKGISLIKKIILLILFITPIFYAETADIIVAKDGSGNYKTIQEALDAVPQNNGKLFVILIKKGLYHEKLFISKSNVALVGEERDSTRIVYAELRNNWTKDHANRDFGSASINIDSTVTDLTFANLTIYNNYGALYGDHNHQYAIYGKGTKIIIIDCNVLSDGADTVTFRNKSGLLYHANCYFNGHVDYVCPYGWCYITDSKFYGFNLTASLWHHGIENKDEKLVIRYSYFDGIPGFPLGRHHGDGQMFLLDCIFSENMADIPIFLPVSPNSKTWVWGDRHYYYNCHRLGGDYDWFKDNLASAEGSPIQDQINAKWTFGGQWDPEGNMPAVLPFVSLPNPRNGSYYIPANSIMLNWVASRNANSHKIYFWKSKFPQALKNGEKLLDGPAASGNLVFIKEQEENSFNPGQLEPNSTYYWRIDEVTDNGIIKGPLWHFTTK